MIHSFYKDHEGWFIDLPEFLEQGLGSKGNLAMVAGADHLLDILSGNGTRITIRLETEDFEGQQGVLIKDGFSLYGQDYIFTSQNRCDHKLWLCPVTKYVFGGRYPKKIYISVCVD
jgi:hypothetical protein